MDGKLSFDLQRFAVIEAATVTEFTAAISNAVEGDTIKLTGNLSVSSGSLTFDNKTLTLDLNGHTITSSDTKAAIYASHGSVLTVTDSSENATGKIVAGEVAADTENSGILSLDSKVILEKGTIEGFKYGIRLQGDSSDSGFVMNGGSISATDEGIHALYNTNSSSSKCGTITVNNGTISGYDYGIFSQNAYDITMNGGTISSDNKVTVVLREGSNFILNDGTVTSTNSVTGYNKGYAVVQLGANRADYVNKHDTFIMNGGTISTAEGIGINGFNGGGEFVMNGGSITAGAYAITDGDGEGNSQADSTITINDGTLTA